MATQLQQEIFVEFETAGELLHDLPRAIDEQQECWRVVLAAQLRIAQRRPVMTLDERITRLDPLAFNQRFKSAMEILIV